MKKIILFALLALPVLAFAQRPEKITIVPGFWGNKYLIGDKAEKPGAVLVHLDQYCPPASLLWGKSMKNQKMSLVFSLVGIGAALYGIASDDDLQTSGAYLVTSACVVTSLAFTISSNKNRKQAAGLYNRQYNY